MPRTAGCYASTLPWPCSNAEYESAWARRSQRSSAMDSLMSRSAICFSRTCAGIAETRLAGTGLTPLFPLWKVETDRLIWRTDMIDGGLRAF